MSRHRNKLCGALGHMHKSITTKSYLFALKPLLCILQKSGFLSITFVRKFFMLASVYSCRWTSRSKICLCWSDKTII